MQPHHTRLKVGCRSAVASAPQKWWAREDLHLQGSQILDLWGLLFPLNHSPGNWCSQPESHRQPQPSEGCALIIELQERKNGASRRCCPGATFLQRKPAGCRKEAKWSQSPVLPWTQRAYETCLSAGSTAENWSPHPEWTSQVLQVGCPKKGSSLRETQCTELPPIPMERIAENALRAMRLASMTALNLFSLQPCQQTPSGFFAPK